MWKYVVLKKSNSIFILKIDLLFKNKKVNLYFNALQNDGALKKDDRSLALAYWIPFADSRFLQLIDWMSTVNDIHNSIGQIYEKNKELNLTISIHLV